MYLILCEFNRAFGDHAVCCAHQVQMMICFYRRYLTRNLIAAACVAIVIVISIGTIGYAEGRYVPVSTQSALFRQLQQPVSLSWRNVPIRSGMNRISSNYRVSIIVDRRVDPQRTLNVSAQQTSVMSLLAQAASQLNLHAEIIGHCVYIGPYEPTRLGPLLLEMVNAKVNGLPEHRRKPWLERQSFPIPRLTEPRELAERVCRSAGIELARSTAIPHDLWAEQSWPRLSPSECLTLILLGFDMTFDVLPNGSAKIISIDRESRLKHSHPIHELSESQASRVKEQFPDAELSDSHVSINAKLDTHMALRSFLRENRLSHDSFDNDRVRTPADVMPRNARPARAYSLTVKNQPFQAVASGLANKLGLTAKFDDSIGTSKLNQLISFQVDRVTRNELFDAMVDGVDLRFTIEDEVLLIHP